MTRSPKLTLPVVLPVVRIAQVRLLPDLFPDGPIEVRLATLADDPAHAPVVLPTDPAADLVWGARKHLRNKLVRFWSRYYYSCVVRAFVSATDEEYDVDHRLHVLSAPASMHKEIELADDDRKQWTCDLRAARTGRGIHTRWSLSWHRADPPAVVLDGFNPAAHVPKVDQQAYNELRAYVVAARLRGEWSSS